MTRNEKRLWMLEWCTNNGCTLALESSCGFGRDCVGVLVGDNFPEYEWWDDDYTERQDPNGKVWTPEGAYHKHPCVAVLGHGEEAEDQLFQWLKWFDKEGFKVEEHTRRGHLMQLMVCGLTVPRMVKHGW
jgi:hypothetical protein